METGLDRTRFVEKGLKNIYYDVHISNNFDNSIGVQHENYWNEQVNADYEIEWMN